MKFSYGTRIKTLAFALCALASCIAVGAQASDAIPPVLITNTNIFDGKSEKLATGMSVLVEGNKIAKSINAPNGATLIDGGGRTLMPGLIEYIGMSTFLR